MGIRIVVFDIGGVLEINEDMNLARRWADRFGLSHAELGARLDDVWAQGAIGTITEQLVHEAVMDRLGIGETEVEAMMAEMWAEYVGVGNTELIDYAGMLRSRCRTGILSNSFVGAREREQAKYGFEELVEDIVYSHEVGLAKPDRAIYELTCARFDVEPEEMVFVDNMPENVAGAREFGIRAVLHETNAATIAVIEQALVRPPAWRGDPIG